MNEKGGIILFGKPHGLSDVSTGFFIMFLIISLLINMDFLMLKFTDGVETSAVITDIDKSSYRRNGKTHTDYDVYVTYFVCDNAGHEIGYSAELNTYDFTMKKGGNVQILYSESNPHHIACNIMVSWLFLIISIIGLTGSLIAKVIKRKNSDKE